MEVHGGHVVEEEAQREDGPQADAQAVDRDTETKQQLLLDPPSSSGQRYRNVDIF